MVYYICTNKKIQFSPIKEDAMISYEKVRQALRTSTIVIIILNIIGVLLSVIGFVAVLYVSTQFDNEEFRATLPPEQLSNLENGILLGPFAIFIFVLSFIVLITIVGLSFRNLSKIKQQLPVSLVPYILGIVYCTFNFVNQFFSEYSLWAVIILLAQLALYGFALYKAKVLNDGQKQNDLFV